VVRRREKRHGVIVGSWSFGFVFQCMLCFEVSNTCRHFWRQSGPTCLHGGRQSGRVPVRPHTASTHKSAAPVPGPSAGYVRYCRQAYQHTLHVKTTPLAVPPHTFPPTSNAPRFNGTRHLDQTPRHSHASIAWLAFTRIQALAWAGPIGRTQQHDLAPRAGMPGADLCVPAV